MWGKLLTGFIGFSAGWLVAAGLFAFIVMIGVVMRMMTMTKTAKYVGVFEDSIVLGAAFGCLVSLFQPRLPFGVVLEAFFGLFSGVYAGTLAIALAEAVDAIPVFTRRVRMMRGLPFLVVAFAVGKGAGAFYQMVIK